MMSKMGMASTLGLMGTNMTAAGARVRNMEQDSTDALMGVFINAPQQMMI